MSIYQSPRRNPSNCQAGSHLRTHPNPLPIWQPPLPRTIDAARPSKATATHIATRPEYAMRSRPGYSPPESMMSCGGALPLEQVVMVGNGDGAITSADIQDGLH